MAADMLISFIVLVLFAAFFFLHQFTIIRRQHEQILKLETVVALKTGDPNVVMHVDREDLTRQNQAESNTGMHIRPIT